MKIPKSIRIMGFDWTVEENAAVTWQGDCFASAHYKEQKIFLEPSIPHQKKEEAILHEILHALFWQTGLLSRMKDVQGIKEEEIVAALSMGLYQVLKDNGMLK